MWKGKNSYGIMKKDGEINFSKLEQQIDSAVQSDKMYWTQNEAKIRAVTNKVASYEEFVDIVKASHLKPLEKGDRISDIKVFKQPWNISVRKGESSSDVLSESSELANGSVTNLNQFNREWKRLSNAPNEQYLFLMNTKCETILKIFQTEIGLGLLGEIVSVMHKDYNAEHAGHVANILYTFSNCGRFDLSLRFLSQHEKNDLSELLNKLLVDYNTENIEQLKAIYFKIQ